MAAPVTHFEINARDAKRAHQFYSSMFGWNVEFMGDAATGMTYGMINTGVAMGINGGLGQTPAGAPPSVTFYVQVEDMQSHLDRATALGGRVIVPVTEAGMVTFAQFADPEGNVVGLVKGPQTPPKPKAAAKKKAAPRKKSAPKKKVARKPKRKTAGGKRRK